MDEQNSTVKIWGSILGLAIFGYLIFAAIGQFNTESAELRERGVAVADVEEQSEAEVDTEEAPEENTEESAETTDDNQAAAEVAQPEENSDEAGDTENAAESTTEDSDDTPAVATEEESDVAEATEEEPTEEEVAEEEVAEEEVAEEETASDADDATVDAAADEEVGSEEAVAAADTSEANSAESTVLQVQAGDLFFGEPGSNNLAEAPIWTVSSGQEINLEFQNNGGVQHNWAVLNLGVTEVPIPFFEDENADLLFYNPGLQDAGTTFEATLNAPAELGEYLVICTAPGHYPLMQGRLVVE